MKKYYYQGSPIELGKPFEHIVKGKYCTSTFSTTCLTKPIADILVEKGTLTCTEVNDSLSVVTFTDCINYLAGKNHWSIEKTTKFVAKVGVTCNAAALSMINKAAAVLLDRKYEGHIADSNEIWCISFVDWQVHKLDKATIKDYMNFAAYRTKEDALVALEILKKVH